MVLLLVHSWRVVVLAVVLVLVLGIWCSHCWSMVLVLVQILTLVIFVMVIVFVLVLVMEADCLRHQPRFFPRFDHNPVLGIKPRGRSLPSARTSACT